MSEPTAPANHGNGEAQHLEGQLPDAPMPQEAPATNGTADSMDVEMKEEPVESNLAPANVPPAQNTATTSTSIDTPTNTTTTATSTPPTQFQAQPPPPQAAVPSAAAPTTSPPPAQSASTTIPLAAPATSASTPTSTAPTMPPRDHRADSATRTGSPRPGQQAQQQQLPREALPHGAPTRVYLNTHVTPHLLEAMKKLVAVEPEKPLEWLSKFLAEKSKEVEGTGAGNGASSG
ncbi:hypothetical protein HDK77DRAFT_19967 [Phyllosticta capitalensis]|uniref:Dpy-30 domain-containing protein n=1 Tax=Phyllosticta capitalensis TaxID=121624 RepID=A0ABR1YZ97_9PEZI